MIKNKHAEYEWARIPKDWPDSRVFIVGGGPSVANFDWSLLEGQKVIGCNAAAVLLPPSTVKWAIFGDNAFLSNFRSRLRKFVDGGGVLVNVTGKTPRPENHWMLTVNRMNGRKAWGLSDEPSVLRWNRSTGGCAIGLAVLLGAAEVALIGYDMKSDNGTHNWHQEYLPYYVKRTKENNTWWMPKPEPVIYRQMMLRAFNDIARDAEKFGVKIWNCNPNSAIEIFPFKSVDELLKEWGNGKHH